LERKSRRERDELFMKNEEESEEGVRIQETGDRRQETGGRRTEAGNGNRSSIRFATEVTEFTEARH
jgi:hypothetical protein